MYITYTHTYTSDKSASHYTWLAYLLKDHAMLGYIELSVKSIYAIEHRC